MEHPKHRLLTHDEEIDLAMRIEAGRDAAARLAAGESDTALTALVEDGKAARDLLVTFNLRLVHKIAHGYYSGDIAMTYEDLSQEGMVGLLIAVDKFDWRRGVRFATHAVWWIRQHIARQRQNSGTIRVPVHLQNPAAVKSERLRQSARNARCISSLDAPIPGKDGDDSRTLADLLPAPEDTEAEAFRNILVEQLWALHLSPMVRRALLLWLIGYDNRESGRLAGGSHSLIWLAKQNLRAAVARKGWSEVQS